MPSSHTGGGCCGRSGGGVARLRMGGVGNVGGGEGWGVRGPHDLVIRQVAVVGPIPFGLFENLSSSTVHQTFRQGRGNVKC